jgi:hypothetical protein
MPKKLLTIGSLLFALSLLVAVVVQAQSIPSQEIINDFENAPAIQNTVEARRQADQNGEPSAYNTGAIMSEAFFSTSIVDAIAGSYEADNDSYGKSSALMMTNFIADMYANPAANTESYVADLMNSAGIATPAYAQGLGFSSLNPILNVWKTFRNLAYLFFVITFLVIGFLIMFRANIGGKAAITAQQAIPSIIIALLSVTFSYAIAGLLIDAMYLFMFLLLALFKGGNTDLMSQSFITLGFGLIGRGAGDAVTAVSTFINDSLGGGIISNVAGIIGGLTAGIIVAIAILVGVFRLFLELLKTYINIVITIAMAPIALMMGAIPGNNAFVTWVKSLIGNLVAFPTVLILLLIFDEIHTSASANAQFGAGFLPPFLLGTGTSGSILFMIGLALILALPEAITQAKKAFGATEGGVFGVILQAGLQNAKTGVPLGGRLAGMGILGGADALQAGARGFATSRGTIPERLQQARTRAAEGFKRGSTRGVSATSWASRSMGANQPDYLNPFTEAIDKRYNPEAARKEKFLQDLEDAAQRVGLGGIGRPNEPKNTK